MTSIDAQEIERLIHAQIPEATVEIRDLRGDGRHYAAHIVSPAFAGKTRVEQHQMVYRALKDKIEDDLQALAIQTAVPEG